MSSSQQSPQPPTSPPGPRLVDSSWVRYRSVAYLRGQGVAWGVGPESPLPKGATAPGVWCLNVDIHKHEGAHMVAAGLGALAAQSMDYVFLGPRLGEVGGHALTLLKEAAQKLKVGGHLLLHLLEGIPLGVAQQEVGKYGQFQLKDTTLRDGQTLCVMKLVDAQKRGILPAPARPTRRACVCRYGAIGDLLMVTPLVRALHENGYHVTLNITPYCAEVVKGNPYVGNLILQERDAIPNADLGPYWEEWATEYDKYVNLSESVEGRVLKVEGRPEFFTSKAWRQADSGHINYTDHTLALGGYPHIQGKLPELYLNRVERKQAGWLRKKYEGKFLVVWALKGSSHHKQLPLLRPILEDWLPSHPQAQVLLVGGEGDVGLQWDGPQVVGMAGGIPLRESLALCEVADLVVGPESAIVNAASCFPTPKLVLLSHSTEANLCKYWQNTTCLIPTSPCYPCGQLHYTLGSCPTAKLINIGTQEEVGTFPVCCTNGMPAERVLEALGHQYTQWALKEC